MMIFKAELVDYEKFYNSMNLPGNNDIKPVECEYNGVKIVVNDEGIYPQNLLLINAGDDVLGIKLIYLAINQL